MKQPEWVDASEKRSAVLGARFECFWADLWVRRRLRVSKSTINLADWGAALR
jgi:hypothetical protein